MNLQPIASLCNKPFIFVCCKCSKRCTSNHDKAARADLDGPPFMAYYCGACVAILSTPAKAPESVESASPSEDQSTMLPQITAALTLLDTLLHEYHQHMSFTQERAAILNDARIELDAVKGILRTVLENLAKGSGTIICRAIADLYTVVGDRR